MKKQTQSEQQLKEQNQQLQATLNQAQKVLKNVDQDFNPITGRKIIHLPKKK